jgi:hypothetical protein
LARRVLKIFARGNVDVKDSLLWSKVGGEIQWNGINEILRVRHPGILAKVRHETCSRLDLLPLPGEILTAPPGEVARRLPSGAHPIDRQHRTGMFDSPVDAVVLSLQSAATNSLVRHRRDGWLLLPDAYDSWDADSRRYLETECENAGLATLEDSMARLESVAMAVGDRLGAPLLVYNLSPAVPGERTHCWVGAEDALSLRVRRFNLALAELSAKVGFSIVDVERIAAAAGADRVKVDLLHLTAEGWRLVAEEVVRILGELGCLDGPEGIA